MPSWSDFTLLFSPSSKRHTSTSSTAASSSTSTSALSTPRTTPPSSIRIRSIPSPSPTPLKRNSGNNPRISKKQQQRQQRKQRERSTSQPKPISPRFTSLFFPTTVITPEQEESCIYRANYAGSCSDLLSISHRQTISGGLNWEDGATPSERNSLFGIGFERFSGYKQNNHTSLDLTHIPYSETHSSATTTSTFPTPDSSYPTTPYSQSTNNLLDIDSGLLPYITLEPLDISVRTINTPSTAFVNKRAHRKSVDYSVMSLRTERSSSISGLASIERGTEIWSSPFDAELETKNNNQALMAPPPIPSRSALRNSVSTSNLRDNRKPLGTSSAFTLPVDPPTRPTLSPASSSRSSSGPSHSQQPATPPIVSSPSTESTFTLGRKKRPGAVRGGSISGDPSRIKDGAIARESTSGVYTPVTFPGAQGQPSTRVQPPSKVYTPSTFTMPSPSTRPSTLPPPSPSRSTSVSSTSTVSSAGEESVPRTPRTPLTPSSRFLGAVSGGWGSAVTGIKRASATLSTRSSGSASTSPSNFAYTPTSAREGYFSNTIYESSATGSMGTLLAPSLWPAPATPGSASGDGGLGLGLDGEGVSRRPMTERTESMASDRYSTTSVLVGDVPKGKRKPVPNSSINAVVEEEEEVDSQGEVFVVHAL